MFDWLRTRKWLVVNAVLTGLLVSLLGVQVVDRQDPADYSVRIGIGDEKVITLGYVAYAAGSVDYTYDGVDDDVQFQAALDALPATGGRIVDVSAVQKNFSAMVTRAIPNVTIVGSGAGSYFTNNGVATIFTAGGNGWHFSDLRTDAGGIDMGATTGGIWTNVTVDTQLYTYYAPTAGVGSVFDLTANDSLTVGSNKLITTAGQTIYVDGDATGAGDGTSWTDAFTTVQAAWDSLPDVIAHDITIKCRAATSPYSEQVEIASKAILGEPNPSGDDPYPRVMIEGEHYAYGDCEANVGGAGEITDTGAFGDVAIGDTVFAIDLNGANGRAQDYEYGTVDDISNAPNRIGTTLAVTPAANWKYAVMRTEISGDSAREHCFKLTNVNNVSIRGFLMTDSNKPVYRAQNCTRVEAICCMLKDVQAGFYCYNSEATFKYASVDATEYHCINANRVSCVQHFYGGLANRGTKACLLAGDESYGISQYSYMYDGKYGIQAENLAFAYGYHCTITNGIDTNGCFGLGLSCIRLTNTTDNAPAASMNQGSELYVE